MKNLLIIITLMFSADFLMVQPSGCLATIMMYRSAMSSRRCA